MYSVQVFKPKGGGISFHRDLKNVKVVARCDTHTPVVTKEKHIEKWGEALSKVVENVDNPAVSDRPGC